MSSSRSSPSRAWVAPALAVLSAAVLALGFISESAAQGSQTWEFRGFSGASIVSPFANRPFVRNVSVSSDGGFILSSVPCPSGGTFDFAGSMSGTSVTGRAVPGGACTQLSPARGALNAAFPAATRVLGDLEITFSDNTVVTLTGRLLSQHGDDPGSRFRDLFDVALLTTSVQNKNIGLRLSSLRQGVGGGPSVGGLSVTVMGDSVPIGSVLAGMLGGGASADRAPAFGRLGLFVNGLGSFGDRDTTRDTRGFDFSTAGLTTGADYRFTDQFILGAAFGYVRTQIDYGGAAFGSSVNGYSLSAYGTYYLKDQFYVDGILSYGRNDYDLERPDAGLPGTTITARTSGDQFSASASAGYDVTVGPLTAGPTGRVTYTRLHIDGFTERGPRDSDAARISGQTVESLTTALGAQAAYAISTRWGIVMPLVRAEWEHEFKGTSRGIGGTRVADSSVLPLARAGGPDRDYFNVAAGVTATFRLGVSAFLHYEESLGRSSFTNHSFTGGIRFAF